MSDPTMFEGEIELPRQFQHEAEVVQAQITHIYQVRVLGVRWGSFNERDVDGYVTVCKYRRNDTSRIRLISLIPLRFETVVEQSRHLIWEATLGYDSILRQATFISHGEIFEKEGVPRDGGARSRMRAELARRGVLVSNTLLDMWFKPIEQKMLEWLNRITEFNGPEGKDG